MNNYSFVKYLDMVHPINGKPIGRVCEKHTLVGWDDVNPEKPIFKLSYKADVCESTFQAEWYENPDDAVIELLVYYGMRLERIRRFKKDLAGISHKE